jgi:NAD(P)-dependent dehydrogenase (short-subunit alcohol dehydrogenase family)
MDETMKGRVCLVTGATQGIGRETAHALAARGARVTIVGRDPARGQAVVDEIRAATGNPAVELLVADLSSLASVRALAAEVRKRHDKLHVLVNNAGAIFTRREVTVDGLERTFALNHLAYFVLTELLVDVIRASAPARIVNVASGAHSRGRVHFEDLQSEKHYNGMLVYCTSKLENLYFTYELARRLAGSGVTVNAAHPGPVATGWGHNTPGFFNVLVTLGKPFLRTPKKGAETLIYLASSPEVEGVSGRYFFNCRAKRSSRRSYDEAAARRLWEMTEAITRGPSPAPAAPST